MCIRDRVSTQSTGTKEPCTMLSVRFALPSTLRASVATSLHIIPAASFATTNMERSLSRTREALDRSKDSRERRKREIFESVVKRSPEKLSKIRADSESGVRAIFDQQVQSTAGEILEDKAEMMREAGHRAVIYFAQDTARLQECARMMMELRIGAVLAVDDNQNISGIVTERDFVKAVASTDKYPTVGSLMTPIQKLIHVGPDSGLGECLELMREHQIRHLPVLCEQAALETTRRRLAVAKSRLEVARHEVVSKKAGILDALGSHEGNRLCSEVEDNPAQYQQDQRPVVERFAQSLQGLELAREACQEVEARTQEFGITSAKENLLGVISVKDALITVTKAMLKPLAEYAEEERIREIEERVGYSE
eukprot:TRINITY_DN19320_c0_g1_i2.p1 TRINITY_DN19320_c0_g1~~TRINITY_DN19320_c0_g1_i2.p1  ORF type:complete len:367 (-),score=89.59 TRINITY_DN19320_c0_g1_i2:246-1346(-)